MTILVPAYNESATIVPAIEKLWSVSLPIPCEVIVIDDASTDGTGRLVEEIKGHSPCPMKIFYHEKNKGKTAALQTGLKAATGSLTLIYDADLEYDPSDIPLLLVPVLDGRADAVYGSRFLSPERRVLFFWHALGNRFVTAIANMFANLNLTDMETCFKLIRTDILRSMHIRSKRFGFEPEVTVKLGRLGLRVYEIPIRYSGRSYAEGKKIGMWDAVRAIGTIVRAGLFETPVSSREALDRYIIERLSPYYAELIRRVSWAMGDAILEFSPGAGEVTMQIMQKTRIYLVDPDESVVTRLRTRFSHRPNVKVSLWDPSIQETCPISETYDTTLCLHGLEKNGVATDTLTGLASRLKSGGRMILLLPSQPALYGKIDHGLGRSHRFTKDELQRLLDEADLEAEWLRPVNAPGAVGWWVANKIFRSTNVKPVYVRLFRLTMPLFKLERWIKPPFGLSFLVVARPKS